MNALTLEQWIEEFKRLKKTNQEIMGKTGRAIRARYSGEAMVPAPLTQHSDRHSCEIP